MQLTFEIIFILFSTAFMLASSYKMFQIYQLSGYKSKPVLQWFKSTRFDYLVRYFALSFLAFIGMFVFIACFKSYKGFVYIGSIFYFLFSGAFIFVTFRQQKKTPLKFTQRVIRCMVLTAILMAAVNFSLLRLGSMFMAGYSFSAVGLLLIPAIVAFAHVVIKPYEELNNLRYKDRAEKVLDEKKDLIKIGITGSFGKTTAKNILAKMLEQKYKVAYSPSSYNTPMGLAKYINNDMPPESEVLIAEMGARHMYDIKDLALMIKPQYGLITSIGKQHLETFGSLENIKKTKFELIENLVNGGEAFFNNSSPDVADLFEQCKTKKHLTGEASVEGLDASYSDLALSASGTKFTLNLGGQKIEVETVLLGKHVAELIALCAQVAYVLDISPQQIVAACKELKPVPHRLELIDRGDTVVIDDAYNSNLQGATNALEILSKFEGTRIIITPGLVEMGKEEKAANFELGGRTAGFADIAYFIGDRASLLKNGAIKNGMKAENIFVFATLNDALEKLKTVEGKKAILFENDLPDNY